MIMNKKIRRLRKVCALSLSLLAITPAIVNAETVYFKGTPINWDHGRKYLVYSYSDVYTRYYDHAATANSTFSGWVKAHGGKAYAQQFVGKGSARAYWDAR